MKRPTIHRLTLVFLGFPVLCVLPSCRDDGSSDANIRVEQAWARPTPLLPGPGGAAEAGQSGGASTNAAVYLDLENRADVADWLVGGVTPAARAVELHESRMEGEVMRMRPVDSLEVPAGGRMELRPGGLHFMLIGLNRSLEAGDTLDLLLRFRRGGDVEARVLIQRRGGG